MSGLLPSSLAPGTPDPVSTWPDPAWRTWIAAGHGVMARPPWQQVHEVGGWSIYQAQRPPGVPVECLFGAAHERISDGFPRHHRVVTLDPVEDCPPGP